jgi:hypothetical protein
MYVCVGGEVTGVRNRCTIPICFKKEVSLVAECYNELVIKLLLLNPFKIPTNHLQVIKSVFPPIYLMRQHFGDEKSRLQFIRLVDLICSQLKIRQWADSEMGPISPDLAQIEDAWHASLIVFVSLKHNWWLKTRLKNAFFG